MIQKPQDRLSHADFDSRVASEGVGSSVFRTRRARAFDRRRPFLHGLVLGIMVLGALLSAFFSDAFPFQVDDTTSVSGLSLPGVGALASTQPVLTSDVLPDTLRSDELEESLLAISGEGPDDASEDAANIEPVPSLPYILYSVQEGDTASGIAARFSISLRYLLWANPDLRDGELLTVGQMLIVPSGDGILHHIRYGETLSDIAARYGVSVETILGWAGNGITAPDQLLENALVFVPNGNMPVTIAPDPTPVPAATEPPVVVVGPPPEVAPPAAAAPAASSGLIWPVFGPISSYMDGSHPLGIDIDLFNNPGAAIAASTSGTVTFAGGDPCCSYGLYVVIVSPNGIETLYAHLSSISVSAGQQVSQGQTIGFAGCTGYCTGTHLHFEVIDNGVRVNPLAYLP